MPDILELKNNRKAVEDLLSSYQTKIENIDQLFETTHLILSEFQQPFLELKEQRENIKLQLQDLLAKNEHLRRKDFDQMTQSILIAQVEKEKEIRDLLNSYLSEQRNSLNLLRENLTKIKEALAKGEGGRVKESQEALRQLLNQQDERKEIVTSKLKEFQEGQRKMTQRFLELLSKGKELRIRDLKLMLQEFDARRRERLAWHEGRKIEARKRKETVQAMLGEYKKKRRELGKTRKKEGKNGNSREHEGSY